VPAITVKAPGKTILFGEHAVVYGHPAIAVPLNSINLKATLIGKPDQPSDTLTIRNKNSGESFFYSSLPENDPIKAAIQITANHLHLDHLPATEITLSSSIPIASGLGSSAALAVALIRGFSQFLGFNLTNEQVNSLAFKVEKIQHETPSGIDNSVITFNRPIYFIKGDPIEFLQFRKSFTIIVADTGIKSLTRESVKDVRKKLEQYPDSINPILNRIGEIARSAKVELVNGNQGNIGRLMNENHELLTQLGVSCPELDHLVQIARQHKAYGAKLCGSGKGGNIVAMADNTQSEEIKNALLEGGAISALIARI